MSVRATLRSFWQAYGPLIWAVLVVQALFWLMLYPWLFGQGPRPNALEVRHAQRAILTEPTEVALRQAEFVDTTLPDFQCCGPGYRGFRFWVDLEQVPASGLAFASSVGTDNVRWYVNGKLFFSRGSMTLPHITYHGNRREVLTISPGLLQPGANEFAGILVRDVNPWFDLRTPLIAENEPFFRDQAKLIWRVQHFTTYALAVGIALLALCIVFAFRSTQKATAIWAALTISALVWNGIHTHWLDPPYDGRWRLLLYFLAALLAPIAWLNVANEWTERPWRWLRWWSGIVLIGGALFLVACFLGGLDHGYDRASELVDWSAMTFASLVVIRLLLHVFLVVETRVYELAIFLLMVTLLAFQFLSEMLWNIPRSLLVGSLPVLLIGMTAAFIARGIRMFASMDEINAMLQQKLSIRERELAERHRREAELLRRETLLGERERLMGEIHDGIGGQLVALMHANREASMPPAALTQALQTVLDELRFIVHSLQTENSTIGAALGMFRRRIEPRLDAAGVKLRWLNRLPEDDTGFGPAAVLSVCRVLQEAVSNALQHARSREIEIRVERLDQQLLLQVRDFGSGLSRGTGPGHGLASMQRRAMQLGGQLQIESDDSGTTVRLMVPWPDSATATEQSVSAAGQSTPQAPV